MREIAVVGAGTMGAGIAQLAAQQGCTVRLIDVSREVLDRAMQELERQLGRLVEKGKLSPAERDVTIHRIRPQDAIRDLGDVELAVEAVVEQMDIKHKVFSSLAGACSPSAILASNTSSLSITQIAEAVEDRSRVVGMHFFNPAPIMPLVEIVAGRESASTATDQAYEAARTWGKVPVHAKDTPGFIVNRVARGFYLEALRLLGEGVAGVDEIDGIMRLRGGFRMGPFELMDLVGLDVNLAVSTSVYEQFGQAVRFKPHEIQQRLVSEGHHGRKTGRGFYVYENDAVLPACPVDRRSFQLTPLLSDVTQAFAHGAGVDRASATEGYVFTRILAAIINEAGHALSDGVATADDIDLAMTKGTNYPKGPLAWAQAIGPRTVRGALKALNEASGDGRYAPAKYFAEAS
ncbi:MAG: 3-hydroxybutyryl-CoA dehydrogenase [Phycisphaerae bacterium]|nr:3-hydroxybutyryl-CoA dehydrogenase [Phycisphaerae bacterium]